MRTFVELEIFLEKQLTVRGWGNEENNGRNFGT